MKRKIFFLFLVVLCTTRSFAQCDKTIMLTATKTEYLDANGNLQRLVEEKSTIEISKSAITIVHSENEDTMSGAIQSVSCKWTAPFKTGKSVIKAVFNDRQQELRHVTITIEGKKGNITFLAEAEEMPDRKIRVTIDKFEEKR